MYLANLAGYINKGCGRPPFTATPTITLIIMA
jgi:hypothetical protein